MPHHYTTEELYGDIDSPEFEYGSEELRAKTQLLLKKKLSDWEQSNPKKKVYEFREGFENKSVKGPVIGQDETTTYFLKKFEYRQYYYLQINWEKKLEDEE